ncbi:PREDICTED: NADH dehydrogenase [ubiquinone] 1 alpha subcomplex subunit 2-like [Amphimedon queenslandica]|uniref:NADH dehydrogenase [ubiquinone] 1 alpha subcomplex subunit 2 n=1 Tax=Amphimedon queenslandica TaxID=400682 RepID=A0A1X7VMH1_AMPQE|nr:PREDICTED: NADH dehydrogenase [ubiquinone] 1 alpha subcomplex subunit 2-like [Amphimedon queenslandica]|eukprot:XP_003383618.1 PREDICTED: NADH dehydrogenase [ubiquinone] 1 alpha subcomplex subunit 2-like [Amphimedon queenslandica]
MAAWRQALSKNLREVRIHLCQTSESSRGVRDFIETHYVSLKKDNPNFPFLIRECSGVEPKIYGRYNYGQENCISLTNKSSEEVLKSLEGLANSSGQ